MRVNHSLKHTARMLGLAAAVVWAPMAAARAAALPWADAPLNYTVVAQDLRPLLTDVGAKLGVAVQISDGVSGQVHGRLPATPARTFLDNLSKVYGLVWYYDGATLYVSTAAETASKLLPLGNVGVDQLSQALDQLGLADSRWPLRGAGDSRIVMVSGPPHYVAAVEQTLEALTQQQHPQGSAIALFHGQVQGLRS